MADIIKINDNSWRIEDGFVRFFLLEGSETALLVDTGATCPEARQIAETLTSKPIAVLNTHSDPDHVSGNGAFRFFMMHYEDEPYYRQQGGQGMMMPLRDGDVLDLGGRSLKVIHIPGHTPGSVALLDEAAGVLISGDSVQSDNIFMFGPRRNINEFIRSLEQLKGLKDKFSVVWPSHGAFPAEPDLIDKLIEGAQQIVDGKVTGTPAVHRDTPVVLYKFPYAGFFCDVK